jgi:hypothetical protein
MMKNTKLEKHRPWLKPVQAMTLWADKSGWRATSFAVLAGILGGTVLGLGRLMTDAMAASQRQEDLET